MPDKTPVTEGWGAGPFGHIAHFLRDNRAVCGTVDYESWTSTSAANKCPRCQELAEAPS